MRAGAKQRDEGVWALAISVQLRSSRRGVSHGIGPRLRSRGVARLVACMVNKRQSRRDKKKGVANETEERNRRRGQCRNEWVG